MGLEDWFPPLGPYPLKYEVGIGVPFVTLRCHFRKELENVEENGSNG